MEKFLIGDRVKIIEASDRGKKHLTNKTGVVRGPGGAGHEDDDIMVLLDTGGFGYFKEYQLRKI
jgi:hypothetical protein